MAVAVSMTSRHNFVLSRRTPGVQVVPAIAGSESSASTLRIRASASWTASSERKREQRRQRGIGGEEERGELTNQEHWYGTQFDSKLTNE